MPITARRVRLAAVPVLAGLLLGGAVVAYRMNGEGASTPQGGAPVAAASGALVISTDRLDFGSFDSARPGSVVRQVILRNAGDRVLHVSAAERPAGVTVDPALLTLDPGAIGRVLVTASADSGAIRGELRFVASEDPKHPGVVAVERRGPASEPLAAVATDVCGDDCLIAEADAIAETGSIVVTRTQPEAVPGSPTAATMEAGPGTSGIPSLSRTSSETGFPQSEPASVPSDATPVTVPRSMAERPVVPPGNSARDGEVPQPVRPNPRNDAGTSEETEEPPAETGISSFAVATASSASLMGTSNRFYPQQVAINGSSSAGSFSLASSLQIPRIQLAFGESMVFNQQGSAVGSFDPASGQVNLNLPLHAVDQRGNTAPIVLALTTGTVVSRNANGILVSYSGEARSTSGSLRLVGIGKIPRGYRNSAEEQLLVVEILGTLTFADAASARSAAGATGSGL